MIEDEPAAFWAYEIPPGGRLTQHVPPDTCVCLTSAVLASQSEKRCMLRASSGGYSAVLCNLFGSGMHDTAKLGQPFHSDFELMLDGFGAFLENDAGEAAVIAKMHVMNPLGFMLENWFGVIRLCLHCNRQETGGEELRDGGHG